MTAVERARPEPIGFLPSPRVQRGLRLPAPWEAKKHLMTASCGELKAIFGTGLVCAAMAARQNKL